MQRSRPPWQEQSRAVFSAWSPNGAHDKPTGKTHKIATASPPSSAGPAQFSRARREIFPRAEIVAAAAGPGLPKLVVKRNAPWLAELSGARH